MVFYVIAFEGYRAGEQLREVGKDTGEPVGPAASEKQMMCTFVGHHEEGVVSKSTEEIGTAYDQPPGRIFQYPAHADLEQYQTKDGEDGIFVLSDQFSHFRMLL